MAIFNENQDAAKKRVTEQNYTNDINDIQIN